MAAGTARRVTQRTWRGRAILLAVLVLGALVPGTSGPGAAAWASGAVQVQLAEPAPALVTAVRSSGAAVTVGDTRTLRGQQRTASSSRPSSPALTAGSGLAPSSVTRVAPAADAASPWFVLCPSGPGLAPADRIQPADSAASRGSCPRAPPAAPGDRGSQPAAVASA